MEPIISLRQAITNAAAAGRAIGHFNISNMEGVWAVAEAAHACKVPVIIGVSEGERDFFGVHEIAAVVRSLREHHGMQVYLNADHTYSVERVKEAIDAGFDAVIFDGAQLSFEENVRATKACVEYARQVSAAAAVAGKPRDIIVEAELGYIGTSSKVLDAVPDKVNLAATALTSPEDAQHFVEQTGIDMLAPAVGNIHGMLKGGVDPALNIEHVGAIHAVVPKTPLVLHGASGNSAEDIRAAIAAGVAVVHVNTELRVAFRTGLMKALSDHPDEVAPYKYGRAGRDSMQAVVEQKLRLFTLG
jgi:fructose-bisphosphate aldolase class II